MVGSHQGPRVRERAAPHQVPLHQRAAHRVGGLRAPAQVPRAAAHINIDLIIYSRHQYYNSVRADMLAGDLNCLVASSSILKITNY